MVVPLGYTYAYDAAGRLTESLTGVPLACPDQHNYTFDADTNRTQYQDRAGCPGYVTTTTRNSTYDAADRIVSSGYSYDAFGRTTAIPASDTPTGFSDALTYYVNDHVDTIVSNGTTVTDALDPTGRLDSWVNSSTGKTHTDHYSNNSDDPSWTDEWTGGTTTWNRYLPGFNGLAASVSQAGTITLQLANIHGDVFNTIPSTAASYTGYTDTWTDEYGVPSGSSARATTISAHTNANATSTAGSNSWATASITRPRAASSRQTQFLVGPPTRMTTATPTRSTAPT